MFAVCTLNVLLYDNNNNNNNNNNNSTAAQSKLRSQSDALGLLQHQQMRRDVYDVVISHYDLNSDVLNLSCFGRPAYLPNAKYKYLFS